MDSTFVFILILAGLAVALLGMVLIASERELKNKRREIEELIARLESQPQAASESIMPPNDAQSAELLAKNRELENEIQALSGELTQARQTIENLQSTQSEEIEMQQRMRQLTSANEQLARDSEDLRTRLAASQADPQGFRNDETAPALSRMQLEIDELRRALESSHARVAELEEMRKNFPDLNAIAAERDAERQSFDGQISALQKQLGEQQQELAATQTLRERIADLESSQESFRAEIARYESEIPRWQARINAAEENARQLASIQAGYQGLLAKHADLAERQRRLQGLKWNLRNRGRAGDRLEALLHARGWLW